MAPTMVGAPIETSGQENTAVLLAMTKSQNRIPVSP